MAGATLNFQQVDISRFDERKEEVSQELANAAKNIGFFYVTGNDLSKAYRLAVFPEAEKVEAGTSSDVCHGPAATLARRFQRCCATWRGPRTSDNRLRSLY